MKEVDPLLFSDCPIKCLGIDPNGKTYWFLNDRSELVGLGADDLSSGWGLGALFTKNESREWAERHFPLQVIAVSPERH
jgi:hypothetical protein